MLNFLSLFLVMLPVKSAIAQGDSLNWKRVDSLEWKRITHVNEIDQNNLLRIENLATEAAQVFWDSESEGNKCVVSFIGCNINQVLNSKNSYNINDSTSTPFIIYFQATLDHTPQPGNWYEKDYVVFDSQTGGNKNIDWHQLTIMGLWPIGFQIFFENDYFKSRMFAGFGEEDIIYVTPIEEKLLQKKITGYEKGVLIAKFDLTKCTGLPEGFFGKNPGQVSALIEYDISITGH